MTLSQRGSALAETALVVGLGLVVIFNALELGMLGFYQLHADAAAFLTARVQALADASAALSTLGAALPPPFATGPILTTNASGQSQSVATHTWQGLLGFPGAAGATTVTGEFIEPTASQTAVTSPYAFAVPPATLPNYFPQGDINDRRAQYIPAYTSVYIAQNFGTSKGNGWNGVFAEWQDHAQCFAAVGFPNSYANTQTSTSGSVYVVDPKTNPWSSFPNNSAEATIYGWDSGKAGTC